MNSGADVLGVPPVSGGNAPLTGPKTRRFRNGLRRRALRVLSRSLLGTITHVRTTEPYAALTFDDGPDPVSTPLVLDLLERHDAKATFFVLGRHAQRYPDLIARMAAAGHSVANHSFDHLRFPGIDHRERIAQILACERVIAPYGQKLFRPPRGLQSISSRFDALLLGYRVVTWNVVVRDWENRDPEWMVERLEAEVKPGSIVLLHDCLFDADNSAAVDRRPMLEALDMFLSRNRGALSYVTVPDLLACGTPHAASWFIRSDADWPLHDPS
ncbi:MAG TPA: polysaccharide deacetylase family protein [Salinarimonas sp.]|nr:polysaccharide deacetylase family protein [Salinarimonas sp.]